MNDRLHVKTLFCQGNKSFDRPASAQRKEPKHIRSKPSIFFCWASGATISHDLPGTCVDVKSWLEKESVTTTTKGYAAAFGQQASASSSLCSTSNDFLLFRETAMSIYFTPQSLPCTHPHPKSHLSSAKVRQTLIRVYRLANTLY